MYESGSSPADAMSLLHDIMVAAEQIEDQLNAALEPMGLSLAKFTVLELLVEAGEPLPLKMLSERLGCVKSNVTQLVDRLEADKFVQRVPDPGDRRSVRARVTELGMKRYEAGHPALEEAQQRVVKNIPAADRATLEGLLHRLSRG